MKRTLFLLLLLPLSVFAQKLQLGLNAGIQYNAVEKGAVASGRANGYISARVLRDIGRLQLGFTLDAGKITQRLDWEVFTDRTLTQRHRPLYIRAAPYIAPAIVLNYKQRIATGYAYAGIAVGYARGFKGQAGDMQEVPLKPGGNTWDQEYAFVGSTIAGDACDWISFGVQTGYTLPLTTHWSLNTEIAFRYLSDELGGTFTVNRVKYFPVSVGVRYGL
jgi:hypothetical protein